MVNIYIFFVIRTSSLDWLCELFQVEVLCIYRMGYRQKRSCRIQKIIKAGETTFGGSLS